MIVWFTVVFVVICSILIVLLFVSSRENWENHAMSMYKKHLGRPLDPVFENIYKQSTPDFVYNDVHRYIDHVRRGRQLLRKNKLVVAGLVKNCERGISQLQSWYKQILSICRETVFFIVENDSRDKTRKLLLAWSKKDPSVVILCPKGKKNAETCSLGFELDKTSSQYRIEKMAFLRNTYLDEIKKCTGDYVLIVDLDLRGDFFIDGICHSVYCMNNNRSIHAIACNGLVVENSEKFTYYDSFAYADLQDPLEWQTLYDKQNHDVEVIKTITEKYVHSGKTELDRVRSAFGGACLYRKSLLDMCRYLHSKTGYACEHSFLHSCIKGIYVNPRMIFLIKENMT